MMATAVMTISDGDDNNYGDCHDYMAMTIGDDDA